MTKGRFSTQASAQVFVYMFAEWSPSARLRGVDNHYLYLCRLELLSPDDLTRSLRGISASTPGMSDLIETLNDRELEVLRLLATGFNNRGIAAILFFADSTVKTHVEHIIGKLDVSDRVQTAVWAARQGIVGETDLEP